MPKCNWYCKYYAVYQNSESTYAWCNLRGYRITDIKVNFSEIYNNCPKYEKSNHYAKQPVKLENEDNTY